MKKIYKYSLKTTQKQTLNMPAGAHPLHVEAQYGQPHLWAEVYPDRPHLEFTIYAIPTGIPIPERATNYIGSILIDDGNTSLHIYSE